jgi:hypothetical protein
LTEETKDLTLVQQPILLFPRQLPALATNAGAQARRPFSAERLVRADTLA